MNETAADIVNTDNAATKPFKWSCTDWINQLQWMEWTKQLGILIHILQQSYK